MIRRFFTTYGTKALSLSCEWVAQSLLGWIDGPPGLFLRMTIYKAFIGKAKVPIYIWPRVSLTHAYGLQLGARVCINTGVVIDARGGVVIEDDCLIGPNVVIVSSTHDLNARPLNSAPHLSRPTRIESDVWIGANSVILGGVTLATGSIIGAGAVVTKSTVPRGIFVGNPARLIRYRRTEDVDSCTDTAPR